MGKSPYPDTEEHPLDAIINTWWCPGHYITAVAKRRVTIDGATQHEPQTYWMANILLSDDENTAIGLFACLTLVAIKRFSIYKIV